MNVEVKRMPCRSLNARVHTYMLSRLYTLTTRAILLLTSTIGTCCTFTCTTGACYTLTYVHDRHVPYFTYAHDRHVLCFHMGGKRVPYYCMYERRVSQLRRGTCHSYKLLLHFNLLLYFEFTINPH